MISKQDNLEMRKMQIDYLRYSFILCYLTMIIKVGSIIYKNMNWYNHIKKQFDNTSDLKLKLHIPLDTHTLKEKLLYLCHKRLFLVE